MDRIDQEPNPRFPVNAEWAGSNIEIYNVPGIVEEATIGKVKMTLFAVPL
jgi:hypothetical protein